MAGVTKEDIREWAKFYIWSGMYDHQEVRLLIEEQLGNDDEVSEDWLQQLILDEVEAKQQAELSWPEVTDCDRLELAFISLEQVGIIALQMAGFTLSDGLEEVSDVYREAGGKKSDYTGFCFFTEQDVEHALDGHGLCIAFGHFSDDQAKGVAIGQQLCLAFKAAGLQVDWDENINARIFIKNFRWQRRS
ncbi:MAG: hypothetical protein R3B84_01995 [Zavarzinella sp.]